MKSPSVWTEERLEKLYEVHKQGLAYSIISEILSAMPGPPISRNAVSGKCWREKLVAGPEQSIINNRRAAISRYTHEEAVERAKARAKKRGDPRPPRARKPSAEKRVVRGGVPQTMKPKELPKPKPQLALIDVTGTRPWIERQFGECAFPVFGEGADTYSCCRRTGEEVYCREHRAIMTRQDQPTLKRTMRMARLAG